jgi:hypothetical protein
LSGAPASCGRACRASWLAAKNSPEQMPFNPAQGIATGAAFPCTGVGTPTAVDVRPDAAAGLLAKLSTAVGPRRDGPNPVCGRALPHPYLPRTGD